MDLNSEINFFFLRSFYTNFVDSGKINLPDIELLSNNFEEELDEDAKGNDDGEDVNDCRVSERLVGTVDPEVDSVNDGNHAEDGQSVHEKELDTETHLL